MRLKSHESPRKKGRNKKGKGGSAKARQKRKQNKLMVKKLKSSSDELDFFIGRVAATKFLIYDR